MGSTPNLIRRGALKDCAFIGESGWLGDFAKLCREFGAALDLERCLFGYWRLGPDLLFSERSDGTLLRSHMPTRRRSRRGSARGRFGPDRPDQVIHLRHHAAVFDPPLECEAGENEGAPIVVAIRMEFVVVRQYRESPAAQPIVSP